ncbi:MAG: S8 family peptidase [Panacagrimonas sp.]
MLCPFNRKKFLGAALSALLLACGSVDAATTGEPRTQRVIVKFDKGAMREAQRVAKTAGKAAAATQPSQIAADRVLRDLGLSSAVTLRPQRRLAVGAELFTLDAAAPIDIDRVLATLRKSPGVIYAVEDRKRHINRVPDDPLYNQQWHYFEAAGGIRAQEAWDVSTGAGIVVAVVDTGIRKHEDLRRNLLRGYDFISDVETAGDGNGRDPNPLDPGDFDDESPSSWHGTHVSGTVAAVTDNGIGVAGVAFGAKVLPVRTLGHGGGFDSDIADGVIWAAGGAVNSIPPNLDPARVINLSLGGGGPCEAPLQDAVDTARSLGATLVIAAGNSNGEAAFHSPGNCRGVISVAATDRRGYRAPYSNVGRGVDIAAPGGDSSSTIGDGVLSTLNDGLTAPGADSFDFYNGTSMSTPQVAGVAALMLSLNPALTPDEIECTIKATARPFPSPANCPNCGAGIVDALAAVEAVRDGNVSQACGVTTTVTNLRAGRAITVNGARGDQLRYRLRVDGGRRVRITSEAGFGDLDLFVSLGHSPSIGSADCISDSIGNREICAFDTPPGDPTPVRILAYGFREFRDASIEATVGQLVAETLLRKNRLGGRADSLREYDIQVPGNLDSLRVTLSGGTGDPDLVVLKDGVQLCSSAGGSTDETCVLGSPAPGSYRIAVRGFTTYRDVRLLAVTERLVP